MLYKVQDTKLFNIKLFNYKGWWNLPCIYLIIDAQGKYQKYYLKHVRYQIDNGDVTIVVFGPDAHNLNENSLILHELQRIDIGQVLKLQQYHKNENNIARKMVKLTTTDGEFTLRLTTVGFIGFLNKEVASKVDQLSISANNYVDSSGSNITFDCSKLGNRYGEFLEYSKRLRSEERKRIKISKGTKAKVTKNHTDISDYYSSIKDEHPSEAYIKLGQPTIVEIKEDVDILERYNDVTLYFELENGREIKTTKLIGYTRDGVDNYKSITISTESGNDYTFEFR